MSGITPKNMKNILQSFGEYLNITYKLKLDSKLEDKETSWEEVVETFMKEKKILFKEKKTRAKKEKVEGEPKKPTTAFFLYSKDKREEVAEETELKGTDLSKELGRRWREMTDKEKKPYMSEYLKAKEEYEEEMKNFKEENPEAYQDDEKPKKTRKMTGYNVFCREKRPGVKEENEDMTPKEIMTELGRLWSELDDEEKAEWNAKASEESGSESEKSGSKKSGSKKVPKRKTKKASSDEDEEKPKKSKKSEEKPKKTKAPSKKAKKTISKKEKESDDEVEPDYTHPVVDKFFIPGMWRDDWDNTIKGSMTKDSLESFIKKDVKEGDEFEEDSYPVKLTIDKKTKKILCEYTDGEGTFHNVKLSLGTDDLKSLYKYLVDMKDQSDDENPKKTNKSDSEKPKKLETMKVPELKAKAEELGIEDCKTMKKADLIEAIKSKMEEDGNIEDDNEEEELEDDE